MGSSARGLAWVIDGWGRPDVQDVIGRTAPGSPGSRTNPCRGAGRSAPTAFGESLTRADAAQHTRPTRHSQSSAIGRIERLRPARGPATAWTYAWPSVSCERPGGLGQRGTAEHSQRRIRVRQRRQRGRSELHRRHGRRRLTPTSPRGTTPRSAAGMKTSPKASYPGSTAGTSTKPSANSARSSAASKTKPKGSTRTTHRPVLAGVETEPTCLEGPTFS